MTAMSNAQKQKRYRERQKVKGLADAHFDGRQYVTIDEFIEAAAFDWRVFRLELTSHRRYLGGEYALSNLVAAYKAACPIP